MMLPKMRVGAREEVGVAIIVKKTMGDQKQDRICAICSSVSGFSK